MKKIALFLAFVMMPCTGGQVFAHYHHNKYSHNKKPCSQIQNQGGFKGNSDVSNMTVAKAKTLKDDTYVSLKGNILSKTGDEKYLFQDKTGTIEIEIDDDDWGSLEVGPNDTVIIEGEVDKDWNKVSIDVNSIKLAK